MKVPPLLTRISPVISARTQHRRLHLFHEIYTEYPSGKLAACERQELDLQPKPFRIVTPSGLITVNSVIEAFKYVEPMTHLMKVDVDGEQIYRIASLETLAPPRSKLGNLTEKPGRRVGGAREIHIRTDCSSAYLRRVLSRAYQVLTFKTLVLRRVEFHVRVEGDYSIEWALENCPHLRPEIILAAMPEQTAVLAPPLADGRNKLMWALHRKRTTAEWLEENGAESIARGPTKEATTGQIDENETKQLRVRDMATRRKDVYQSTTDRRREPTSILVGDGPDVDKSQAVKDMPRSETKEAESPNPDSCMVDKYQKMWNNPSIPTKFRKAWRRESRKRPERFLDEDVKEGEASRKIE
ncbi:MAG: hypothetical protein Q9195_003358 [Heterodermia aff. obscurata]